MLYSSFTVWFSLTASVLIHESHAEDWHFTGLNVAFNKSASQQPGDYIAGGQAYPASLAVNGNTDADFGRKSCSMTLAGQGANWTVALGGSYLIKGIRIYNRNDGNFRYRIKNFSMEALGANGWNELYKDGTNMTQFNLKIINISVEPLLTIKELTIQIPPNVKVTVDNGNSYLALCEVQIFAAFCNLSDISGDIKATIRNETGRISDKNHCTMGSVIDLGCKDGLELVGSPNVTCLKYGNYSDIIPECKKLCEPRPSILNGRYIQNKTFYNGDTALWTCNENYEPRNENITCNQSGSWKKPYPECKPILCSRPNVSSPHIEYLKLKNDTTYYNETVQAGESLYVVCKDGFYSKVMNLTCSTNRTWSPRPDNSMLCTRITCTNLTIDNSIVNYTTTNSSHENDHDFGTIATVKCKENFRLSKNNTLRCGRQDGSWDGENISCKKLCEPRPSILNGRYIQNKTFYNGDTALWTCNENYEPRNENITCNQSGSWKKPYPECKPILCSRPNVSSPHIEYLKLKNDTTYYNETVQAGESLYVVCKDGFYSKVMNLTCSTNRTWSPRPDNSMLCTRITCTNLTIDNSIVNYTTTNSSHENDHDFGTIATVKCKENFRLSKNNTLRCGRQDGSWDGENISCIATCQTPTTSNGRFVDDRYKSMPSYDNGHKLHLQCNTGYRIQQHTHLTKGTEITCSEKHTWTGPIDNCTAFISSHTASDSDVGGTVGGIVGVVVVLAVILVVVIVIRKRRGAHQSKHGETTTNLFATTTHEGQNTSKLTEDRSNKTNKPTVDDNDYYSFTNTLKLPERGIKLMDLADFVLAVDTANDKYDKEFGELSKGLTRPHEAALKNKAKNRYKTMYAYDESRVVLDIWNPESETDYINACFIHGFDISKAYIASQGATKENLNDIWRMIWQTNCGKVVMLTNLKEGEKVKCEKYWPETGTQIYGSISVTATKTEVFANFIIRTFSVVREGDTKRCVIQFHFTTWPDHGVPLFCSSVVQFRNKVKTTYSPCKGPIVVHCSAGVGRTGTYIALDYLTDQGEALGVVDIAGCVETLRRQRVNMVQTKEQYIFVHHALVETLKLSTSAPTTSEFPDTYRRLQNVDPDKGQRNVDIQFQLISKMSPVIDENQYSTAKDIKYRRKNRYSNILPAEAFMPSIFDHGRSVNSGYINAVFLPSYKESDALIITQTPLDDTKQDFWKMVFHQRVHTIVMMNHLSEMTEGEIYWPLENEKIEEGDFTIEQSSTDLQNGHTIMTITLQFQNMEPRTIRLLQFGAWPEGALLPESTEAMLSALDMVMNWQTHTGNNPALVHCMNGAEKSGLFCVLYALLERTKIEHDVAISQVIQEMRNRRQQIIPNVNQFEYCHDVMMGFLKQYDTYSNFNEL